MSGSSHALSGGSRFLLLTRTAHSAGSAALTGKRTDKRRKGESKRAGRRIKKKHQFTSFQHAHPLCTRSEKAWKRLQLKEISQRTVWDLLNQVPLERVG